MQLHLPPPRGEDGVVMIGLGLIYRLKVVPNRNEFEMANAMEIGNRLQNMAGEVSSSIAEAKGKVSSDISAVINSLVECKRIAEAPVGEVGMMLGDDHPGVEAIAGNTGAVTQAVEQVYILIQQAQAALEGITTAASTLSFVYQNVGAEIAGGR